MKKAASKLLQVAQLGNPILQSKAVNIADILANETQELIDNMIATVMDVDGVGIAAPQVYQSQRLFIVASHPNLRYPDAPLMKPTAIINPKIISTSKDIVKDWEGCLSIPGIRGLIPRFTHVHVEYTNRENKKVQKTFTDFVARIFQHEYDHIEGILFLDRVESTKDLMSEVEYQKLMKRKKKVVKK